MRRQQLILWAGLGAVVILFGLLIIATSVMSSQSSAEYSLNTGVAIESTNSFVGTAISGTVEAKQNRPLLALNEQPNDAVNAAVASGPTATAQTPNRIVIKNATLRITVKDTDATVSSISKIATDEGGWIVDSSTYQQTTSAGAKQTYGTITIRVPAAKLDAIIDQIKASAVSVDNVNVTGEDVTDQYIDLSSQLTNLKSAEEQLRKIMDSATKTEDVLNVFRQLTDIRGQIEVIQGKLKYYDQAAAYSSIAVTLTPSTDNKPLEIGGWQPGNTIRTAFESLVHIVQGLLDVLIWLVIVILPFAIFAYLIYRVSRRFWPQIKPLVTAVPHVPPDENIDQTEA